ncbi:MucBP domain-containing protein [Caproiciproducens sp.]
MKRIHRRFSAIFLALSLMLGTLYLPAFAASGEDEPVTDSGGIVTIRNENYTLKVVKDGFRYGFYKPDGTPYVEEHEESGIRFGTAGQEPSPAVSSEFEDYTDDTATFTVTNKDGNTANVTLDLSDTSAKLEIEPNNPDENSFFVIDARVGGLPHTYGLGDLGAYDNGNNVRNTANLLGINRMKNGEFAGRNDGYGFSRRYVSGFIIAPDRDFAMVVFETDDKRVSLQTDESLLGGLYTQKLTLYYFFGDTKQIYSDYREAREAEGYYDTKPRYQMFGIGWEAYGSLGESVYQQSVEDTVDEFINRGYHLTWGAVGSGFWEGNLKSQNQGMTTSFGMWDDTADPAEGDKRSDGRPNPRFPSPDGMKTFFQDRGVALLLGLRINFRMPEEYGGGYIPEYEGPFSQQAVDNGYLLKDHRSGNTFMTKLITLVKPTGNNTLCGLIDGSNPDAVDWYLDGTDLWGVDGFKEDTMLCTSAHDDSNFDKVLFPLSSDRNKLVIVRCGAYSVPGDILRANDFNYSAANNYNRMPMNLGAFAASGQGNVYPDILGGTGGSTSNSDFNLWTTREAWLDALCPSMSVGLPIWKMKNEAYESAIKKAVTFHSTYAPYIYSAALKNYETGYPYAHTPLYISNPNDPATHELYNADTQTWEWMVGESLLAAPIWGNDYASQTSRDIYLPEGDWMDIETGETFKGPVTLKNYELPLDKTPAFVGGQGILVGEDQENQGNYFAEVYPVVKKGTVYDYTYVDGETTSAITADMDGFNPNTLTVTDTTTEEPVEFTVEKNTSAIRFAYEAGHDYELTGGEPQGLMLSASLGCDSITTAVNDTVNDIVHPSVVMDDGSKVTDLSEFDKVEYEAGNDTILSVEENGTITALRAGNTTLRVGVTKDGQTVWSDAVPVTVNTRDITVTSPAYDAEIYNAGFTVTGTTKGIASMEAVLKNKTGGTAGEGSLDHQNGAFSIAYKNVPDGEYTLTLTGKDDQNKAVAKTDWPLTVNSSNGMVTERFDGSSSLTWKPDGGGTWNTENGTLSGNILPGASAWYVTDQTVSAPFYLSSDINFQNGSTSGGLTFGYTNTSNYYHVRFDHASGIQILRNGGVILTQEKPYLIFDYGKDYNLAVNVHGRQIDVYVNDDLVLSYTSDKDIPEGKTGYRLYNAAANLDNFTLLPGINTGLVKTSYVDTENNPLADTVNLRKPIAADYKTERKEFAGYTLKQTPENETGKITDGVTEVTYMYEKDIPVTGTVTVRYVDEDDHDLRESATLSGEVNTPYTALAEAIPDYTVVGDDTITGRFREDPATITFRYQKGSHSTGTVTVRYVEDQSGREIHSADTLSGEVGTSYTISAKTIQGYSLVGSGTAIGQFTGTPATVVFHYRKNTTSESPRKDSVDTPEVKPSETFKSDTTSDFSVNSTYVFKITSRNGLIPNFVVGTSGVFTTQLVKTDGNDYYFKITAVGPDGAKAGIYMNGVKVAVATVVNAASAVKSDTTLPFTVKAGASYVFKLTADAKPVFVAGTVSAFRVDFINSSGKDHFFRVTAVGKAGTGSGFYINSQKAPVAVASVTN